MYCSLAQVAEDLGGLRGEDWEEAGFSGGAPGQQRGAAGWGGAAAG